MMINSYKLVNQPWENGAKLDFQDTVIFVCCLQERMLGRGHRHAFFPYIYIYLPTNPSHHSSKNLRIPCEEMFGLPKGLLLFGVPNTYSQGIRKTSERVMTFSCFFSHRKALHKLVSSWSLIPGIDNHFLYTLNLKMMLSKKNLLVDLQLFDAKGKSSKHILRNAGRWWWWIPWDPNPFSAHCHVSGPPHW